MKLKANLLISLVCLSQVAIAANEDEMALSFEEEYVSIATGYEEVLSRAPAVASVITHQQIKAMGARTLDDILVSVPGVHVGLSPSRLSPTYSIRGIHTSTSAQVLVLINSIPITQLFRGDRGSFSAIPASTIKQIEIIRGPGSAVYGADAFAGVINVITKNADAIDGLEISGGAGSFDSQLASVAYGAKHEAVNYIFALDYYTTDGDTNRRVNSDSQSLFDSGLNTNVSFASGPNGPGVLQTQAEHIDIRAEISNEKWSLHLWNWMRKNMGLGPGEAHAIDTHGSIDLNNYLVDLTYQAPLIGDNIRLQSTLSYMQINFDSYYQLFPAGTVLPLDNEGNINGGNPAGVVTFSDGFIGAPAYQEEHIRLDLQLFVTDIGDHRIRVGAGALDAKLTASERKNFGPGVLDNGLPNSVDGTLTTVYGSDLYINPSNQRKLHYLSLQDQWYLSSTWDLTAGVRYDEYSDFGATTNPRLALIWHPSYDLTAKLLYGQAFRAPSFAELYIQNNPVVVSDAKLNPEKIKMLELAIDYQINFDLQTRLSLFQYKIEDLIENAPKAGFNALVASNAGERKSPGIEWELTWKATDDLKLTGNYAFQDARDVKNGGAVADTPRQKIFLMSQWQTNESWQVNTTINWVADRQRVKNDPRNKVDDYVTANLIVSHTSALSDWSLDMILKNVFDVNAKEPSPYDSNTPNGAVMPNDYPLEGRSIFLLARYQP